MRLNKEEVAARQLDTAICLFFRAGDIISIHTLASAAATIFADILDAQGKESWREKIIKDNPQFSRKQIFAALRQAQNFFKHADSDPQATLEFEENANDIIIFLATIEYGEILREKNRKLPKSMAVFQVWLIATESKIFSLQRVPDDLKDKALKFFPSIQKKPRFEQLAIGAKALQSI